MLHRCLRACLPALAIALVVLSRPVYSAEASAFLPHTLDDVCPLLPDTAASSDVRVQFTWPLRGAYVYSREVQLQVQALDEAGQDVPFEEMAVTIHM